MARIATPYGPIHYTDRVCKDDYANIELFHAGGGLVVKLQAPALASYRDTCKVLGRPIPLTGSWRSCAYQTELYNSPANHHRYADPKVTAHCKALAIDVSQAQPAARLARIHELLTNRDWHQVRADEPWHYSFGVTV